MSVYEIQGIPNVTVPLNKLVYGQTFPELSF